MESKIYEIGQENFEGQEAKFIRRNDLKEGNQLFMIRGFQTDIAALQDIHHPQNRIYLDGACQGPYFDSDPKRKIYSLDHHAGCIRAITLSTCEQALRLTKSKDLGATGYKIIGNDPDLDTVLASWALLNADRITHDIAVFRRILPLYLLEGNIDALGLNLEVLTGLSEEEIRTNRERIHWLMEDEMDLKSQGRWNNVDWIDFLEASFNKLDEFAFYEDPSSRMAEFQRHKKEVLPNGQTLDFVQTREGGIYEVEKEIMTAEDSNSACILYYDGKAKWSIKLTGLVSSFSLNPIWKTLSQAEHEAKQSKGIVDSKLLEADWGGANNLGGSPRYYNGMKSFLSSEQIVKIVFEELSKQLKS